MRRRDVVAIGDEPARSRNDSEAAEEIAGDEFDVAEFGLPVDDQIELPRPLVCEEGREDVVVIREEVRRRATENPGSSFRLPARRTCCRCDSGPRRDSCLARQFRITSSPGFRTGRARIIIASMTLYIAVFAPMPSASDNTAMHGEQWVLAQSAPAVTNVLTEPFQ